MLKHNEHKIRVKLLLCLVYTQIYVEKFPEQASFCTKIGIIKPNKAL